jgi:L-threonylcarbamoyladenylate synthase
MALRLMDEKGVGAVVVEGVMEEEEGLAIMNRVRKAASRIVVLTDQGQVP